MLNAEWIESKSYELTTENLQLLFEGRIPIIAVPEFLSKADCEAMLKNLATIGMKAYDGKPVSRIGPSQIESHLQNEKAGYFAQVDQAFQDYRLLTAGVEDPVRRVMRLVERYTGRKASIAQEEGFGSYYAGSFRGTHDVVELHADVQQVACPGWRVGESERQLSWNIYLNEPGGGALHLFDRVYRPDDDRYAAFPRYKYDPKLVEGRREFICEMRTGQLVFFNAYFFHYVQKPKAERYSLSTFITRMPNEDGLEFFS